MGPHYLNCLFSPRAIAVFGASGRLDSVGGRVLENLRVSGFKGAIYAINPKYARIGDLPCYPSIHEVDDKVDLAVIAIPASSVPEVIHQCGEQGIRAAIIISAGFSEGGESGTVLEKQVLEAARQYQMRILGPNCLGLIRPSTGMNATFSKNTAKPGQLALVSQSGALCTAILDWAIAHDVGFSALVSLGDAADVDFGDVLDYLAQDPETRSILLYVEGVRNARSFISGLRIAARMKPVIVLKAGRHNKGARAAITHTAALIGADDVFDAALQRAGAVRAMTIEQLFAAAHLLSTPYRVGGNRLAIITNGGGLGVMASDRAADLGVEIATLSGDALSALEQEMPPHWSHGNPVDLLGDAAPRRYARALAICLNDPGVDGVLVMLAPQAMTETHDCAKAVIETIESYQGKAKPVLACWMGEQEVAAANRLFSRHHVPYFSSPESSVEAFAYLANYHRNQQLLMQVPGPLSRRSEPDTEGARLIIESALAQNRGLLSSTEAKALLHAFNIPITQSIECDDANEALVAAESIGFPVAIKINSPDISHKTDVDGVRLNVANAHAVRSTYKELLQKTRDKLPEAVIKGVTVEPMYTPSHGRELMIGVIRDPVFGPTITFGAGGVQVEIFQDRTVALPPLNEYLALQMIEQTRVSKLLGDFRGMPAVNKQALVQVLRRLSEMICELPEIQELDINPLIADEQGAQAVDVRIIVTRRVPSADRYAHMAIHPYPAHLVSQYQLANGTNIVIRPIRPEDASIEQSFVRKLSQQSKYFRFMRTLKELTQEMLVRFTQLDYHRELALIAVTESAAANEEIELAVARYVTNPDGESCEFALVVADEWQHKGIGSHLMSALMDAARQHGLKKMEGEILSDNHNMLELVERLGFSVQASREDTGVKLASKLL